METHNKNYRSKKIREFFEEEETPKYEQLNAEKIKELKELKAKQLEESKKALERRTVGSSSKHKKPNIQNVFTGKEVERKRVSSVLQKAYEELANESKRLSKLLGERKIIKSILSYKPNINVELSEELESTARGKSLLLHNKYESKLKPEINLKNIVYEYCYDLTIFVYNLINAYYINQNEKEKLFELLASNKDIALELKQIYENIKDREYLYENYNELFVRSEDAYKNASYLINLTKNGVKLGKYKTLISKYIKLLMIYITGNKTKALEKLRIFREIFSSLPFEIPEIIENNLNILNSQAEREIINIILS